MNKHTFEGAHRYSLRLLDAELHAHSDAQSAEAMVLAAIRMREHADAIERAAVHIARDRGVTWIGIANLYGITRQAAQQRFAQPD